MRWSRMRLIGLEGRIFSRDNIFFDGRSISSIKKNIMIGLERAKKGYMESRWRNLYLEVSKSLFALPDTYFQGQ